MVGFEDPEFRRIDDAVFHRACFMKWEHRDRFICAWNKHWPWLSSFPKWRIYLINDTCMNGFELSLAQRLKAEWRARK